MMTDTIELFRDAIRLAGIEPPETIKPDGELHRFGTNGKAIDDSGWYTLHLDNIPAGAYGDWRSGLSETWSARKPSDMSETEREQYQHTIAETRRQRDAERERRHAEARTLAAQILGRTTPETGEHRYLRDKGVNAYGIRCDADRLVIPMRDTNGTLHSIQYIDSRGDKRFLKDGRVSGCYHAIGKPNGTICICEGYATGASIHEATKHAVAIAFNAGNLEPVAKALRTKSRPTANYMLRR